MKVRSATFTAGIVTLGAFTLPDFIVAQIGGGLPYVPETLDQASGEIRSAAKISEGLSISAPIPARPPWVTARPFSRVPTGPVSVIAQQSGATFVPTAPSPEAPSTSSNSARSAPRTCSRWPRTAT